MLKSAGRALVSCQLLANSRQQSPVVCLAKRTDSEWRSLLTELISNKTVCVVILSLKPNCIFVYPFHHQVSQLFMTKAWQTSMALSLMELWSTMMEWLLLMYQSTWNNHQSAQEPPKHLTSRKTKRADFLRTLKGQHGHIPFSFFSPNIHETKLQPSRGVVLQMLFHSALHSSSHALLSEISKPKP